ncbi:MAG: hypothetical protein OEW77_00255 [Gemmatimonadota bacterium]|nr:hypothetical protein [Gemmatimonadota bacterium]
MQQTATPAPSAPAGPGAVTQSAAPVLAGGTPSSATPAEAYQAARAQRRELANRMESLVDTRRQVVQQLREGAVSAADRAGLDQRLAQVDQQISATTIDIGEADRLVAQAAAVPGSTTQEPPTNPWAYGPPEELVAMSIGLTALLLFPVMLAWARRIWRRSPAAPVPAEITDRLGAMERAIDAVAVEVERIGEGQRFVTHLLSATRGGERAALPVAEMPSQAGGPPSLR